MTDQWYWKHRGDLIGPIDTAALEKLVHQHRIHDRDEVRPASSEEWTSGAEIRAMFENAGTTASPSEAASQLLSKAPGRQGGGGGRSRAARPPGTVKRLTDGLTGMTDSVMDALSRLADFIPGWVWRGGLFIGLPMLVIAGLMMWLDIDLYENQRIYGQVSAAFDQLQEFQQQSVRERPPDELSRFVAETSAWLDPTIQTLELRLQRNPVSKERWFGLGDASANARWNLLGAARDLRVLVADAAVPSQRSADFQEKLQLADFHLTGAVPDNPTHPDRFKPVETVDPLTLSIVVADVVIVCGIVVFLFRRKS